MSKVGIFWFYKKHLIGKATSLVNASERVSGILDSDHNHAEYWERECDHLSLFPELRGVEYQDVPRGRVLHRINDDKSIIYLEKRLINEEIKSIISLFFEFDLYQAIWKTDIHYTTSQDEINHIFNS